MAGYFDDLPAAAPANPGKAPAGGYFDDLPDVAAAPAPASPGVFSTIADNITSGLKALGGFKLGAGYDQPIDIAPTGVMAEPGPISPPLASDAGLISRLDRQARVVGPNDVSRNPAEPTIAPVRGAAPTISNMLDDLGSTPGNVVESGKQGARALYADLFNVPGMREDALRRAGQVQLEESGSAPQFQDPTLGAVYGGVKSVVQTAPALALSALNPGLALGAMGAQTALPKYAELRADDVPVIEALGNAAAQGTIEAGTELFALAKLMKLFGRPGLKTLAGLAMSDIPGEQAATLGQNLFDAVAASKKDPQAIERFKAEIGPQAYQTLISTLTQTALMGGAAKTAQTVLGEREQPREPTYRDLTESFGFTGKPAALPTAPPSQIPVPPPSRVQPSSGVQPQATDVANLLAAIQQSTAGSDDGNGLPGRTDIPAVPGAAGDSGAGQAPTGDNGRSAEAQAAQVDAQRPAADRPLPPVSPGNAADQALTADLKPTANDAELRADGPVLQNRDRSSAASIKQMNAIAAAPDPARLSFSREFATGAPVVFSNADAAKIPAPQMGRQDTITDANGKKYSVQYAVVEADDVLTSNRADGTPVKMYGLETRGLIKTVAGNARMAGLQAAYERGTTAPYVEGLGADAALTGIDPGVLAAMNKPVLVRIMRSADVTGNIGDVSNQSGVSALNATEQAATDAGRVDFGSLEFDDNGQPTLQSVMSFVRNMPEAEQGGLLVGKGQPAKQAAERLMAATFSRAYGDPALVELYAQATDPEARTVLAGLAQAAGSMSRLADVEGQLDFRPWVIQAARLAVNAARQGVSISKMAAQRDMQTPAEAQQILEFMAANSRSAKKIGDGLRRAADFAFAEGSKSDTDMFGAVQRATPADVLERVGNEVTNQQGLALGDATRPAAYAADATRPGEQGTASPVRAGDRAAPRGTEGKTGVGAVRERLLQARQRGELDDKQVKLALWLLERAPQVASGVSLRVQPAGDVNGLYNVLTKIVDIFANRANEGTVVHELLHNAERFMPADVQAAIRKEWERAKKRAADRKETPGWTTAEPGESYELTSPSEYWAVNATRIIKERAAEGWVKKAIQWLRELGQRARAIFGLPSDAPVLNGLKAVLQGQAVEQSGMIGGGRRAVLAEGPKRSEQTKATQELWHDGDDSLPTVDQLTPEQRKVFDSIPVAPSEGPLALPDAERPIETRARIKLAVRGLDEIERQYGVLPDAEKGKVLNTDVARELFNDYLSDRTKAAAVHEPSSWAIKQLYARKLARGPAPGESPVVLFTSGGTGAGKSSALSGVADAAFMKANAFLVYDTNVDNAPKGIDKMEQAQKAGFHVFQVHVVRDPIVAMTDGALPRAEKQSKKFGSGRTVQLGTHIKTHVGANKAIGEVVKHFDGNEQYGYAILDNRVGKGETPPYLSLAEVPSYNSQELEGPAKAALDDAYENGKISAATYQGFAGRSPEEAGLRLQGVAGRAQGEAAAKPAQQRQERRSDAVAEETADSPARPGDQILVYRVGTSDLLNSRNAGNSQGVADFLARADDGMSSVAAAKGENLHVYRITVPQEWGKYAPEIRGRASGATAIGRKANGDAIWYSFHQNINMKSAGSAMPRTGELVKSIPMTEVRAALKKAGYSDFDEAGSIAGGKVIRELAGPDVMADRTTPYGRDLEDQATWLNDKAKAAGFKDVDALAKADLQQFINLAAEWRDQHPLELADATAPLGAAASKKPRRRDKIIDPVTGRLVAGERAYAALDKYVGGLLRKIGLASNAPPELRRLLQRYRADQEKAKLSAVDILEASKSLPEAERELLSDFIEGEVRAGVAVPEHLKLIAQQVDAAINRQTQQLLELGLLTEAQAKHWQGRYLPRYYAKDVDQDGKTIPLWRRALRIGIKAQHSKSRGIMEVIPRDMLDHFRAQGFTAIQGADTQDPNLVAVWRDFTKAEREKMGEVRDAAYRFARGVMETGGDIAAGRIFKSIANSELATRSQIVGNKRDWRQVPDVSIPGTQLKKFGELSGMYVPEAVWKELAFMFRDKSAFEQGFAELMALWKEGKTAMNPATHAANVASNIMMADIAGVSPIFGLPKYVAAIKDFRRKGKMTREAIGEGLLDGNAVDELREWLPDPGEVLKHQGPRGIQALFETRAATLIGKYSGASWYRKHMRNAYGAEDSFFKLLIFTNFRERGMSAEQAALEANRYIFDYRDLPPLVQQIRNYAIPFISYTYKAIPAVAHAWLTRPWVMAKYAAIFNGINALSYALGGDDDEDYERRMMPKYMRGWSPLGYPSHIRVADDREGNPQFLNIGRLTPLGTLFNSTNGEGLTLPQAFMPSHPLLMAVVTLGWNVDTFTGKEFFKPSDDNRDRVLKTSRYLFQQFAPAMPLLPGSYGFDKLANGVAATFDAPVDVPELGITYTGQSKYGQEESLARAAGQTLVGVNVRGFDPGRSERMEKLTIRKEIQEINGNIRAIQQAKDIGPETKAARIRREQEKRAKLVEKMSTVGEE